MATANRCQLVEYPRYFGQQRESAGGGRTRGGVQVWDDVVDPSLVDALYRLTTTKTTSRVSTKDEDLDESENDDFFGNFHPISLNVNEKPGCGSKGGPETVIHRRDSLIPASSLSSCPPNINSKCTDPFTVLWRSISSRKLTLRSR